MAGAATNQERLETLVRAGHPCIWISTPEEPYALDLVKATAMQTGRDLLVWSATRGITAGPLEDARPLDKVTMAEHVHALREWARGRCVAAD